MRLRILESSVKRRPAMIRIERIMIAPGIRTYWRVWIFCPRGTMDWDDGRCRGAVELRDAVEQVRRARRGWHVVTRG